MNKQPNTNVRMFGALHTIRKNQGLKPAAEVHIPSGGWTGRELAGELNLPLSKIEGVFINHFARSLDERIRPGDKVAFISTGVPGPHRFSLGVHTMF